MLLNCYRRTGKCLNFAVVAQNGPNLNHTTLQLTCSSQWNSSRYQYDTALYFNLSESSFTVFIESFHIAWVLIDKDGTFAGVPRSLTTINPRTVSPKFRYCN